MNEIRPLLSDPDASDFDRLLLTAWKTEQPPAGGRAKTLAALGVASSTVAAGAAIGSVAPKAIATATLSFSKWVLLGLLALSGVGATIVYVHAASRTAASNPIPNKIPAAPSEPSADLAPVVTASEPKVAIDESPVASAAAAAAPNSRKSGGATGSEADSLGSQIAMIDGARKALAARDPKRAQSLAAAYQERFPNGAFAEEAQTLQISALDQAGDHAKASALASAFLAAHPSSIYAARVRSVAGGGNP